jgi:hypothetical protein
LARKKTAKFNFEHAHPHYASHFAWYNCVPSKEDVFAQRDGESKRLTLQGRVGLKHQTINHPNNRMNQLQRHLRAFSCNNHFSRVISAQRGICSRVQQTLLSAEIWHCRASKTKRLRQRAQIIHIFREEAIKKPEQFQRVCDTGCLNKLERASVHCNQRLTST